MKLPDLSPYDVVAIDCETDGLYTHKGARPCGIALAVWKNGQVATRYLPIAHREGPNLDQRRVVEWANEQLVKKTVVMHHARFDLHMLHAIGIKLPYCRFIDTMITAALLDERGQQSLDAVAKRYLGEGKLPMDDKAELYKLPASQVEQYARKDADLTLRLYKIMLQAVLDDDLRRVWDLEMDLIPCVVDLEEKGVHFDVNKAEQWLKEITVEEKRLVAELGVLPNSSQQIAKLFDQLGISYERTEKGNPTITADALQQISHPVAGQILQARRLQRMTSFIKGWLHETTSQGLIHSQLNQLRGDEYGTVSGRFSSSNPNLQQVPNVERQHEEMGAECPWILRELFVPPAGRRWFSADYSQIEFRLFAHYSGDEQLIAGYQRPGFDPYQHIADVVGTTRKHAKKISLGILYGMGATKLATTLGLDTFIEGGREQAGPRALQLLSRYHEEFPAAKRLAQRAARLAERRGFVRTLLGRRRRFVVDPPHKAINSVLQGGAADVMKERLLAAWKIAGDHGGTIRLTIHDELDGDLAPGDDGAWLKKEMEAFSLPLRVPLVVDLKIGDNWAVK